MAKMRCLILLLMLALSGAGFSLVAQDSLLGHTSNECVDADDDESKEWEGRQSQLPLATLQEAVPLGQNGLRPQRLMPGHVNVLTRGGSKGGTSITSKCLDKARWSCGPRQESAPFSISVSSDYYVIALRHIIR